MRFWWVNQNQTFNQEQLVPCVFVNLLGLQFYPHMFTKTHGTNPAHAKLETGVVRPVGCI